MEDFLFQKAYDSLNILQRKAVDTIEGPVMVIAGPGTGKTQILTLRIANILLQTDTQPENILALTFTESGARAMRERLRTYIGARAYRVSIYTFHGFAEHLIHAHPDAFPRIIGGRPAGDVDKVRLIGTILEHADIKRLRPMGDPTYYIAPIQRTLSTLKQEYITPDDFSTQIGEDETVLASTPRYHEKGAHAGKERSEYTKRAEKIEKNRELLYVYRLYESALAADRLYDYDDMIAETVRALTSNENLLRELQETYQYVLADEHQDVNGSQNRILELLTAYHDFPNLFVVGDEKQGIFRFQGASLENFLYFEDTFAGTQTIALTDNYRSGTPVLDVAYSLIKVDDGPLKELRIPLRAASSRTAVVELRAFSHEGIEDWAVIRHISTLLAEGIPPEEIAVIVRTNREVESCAHALRAEGIRVRASAESDILTHPLMRAVRDLMTFAANPASEEALFRVLHHAHWDIPLDDLVVLLASRSYHRPLVALLSDPAHLEELGLREPERIKRVLEVAESTRNLEDSLAPHRVLEHLLTESGFLAHALAADPVESGRFLRRIYDEVELMVRNEQVTTILGVCESFDLRAAHGIALNAPAIDADTRVVTVLTAHKSKGLEFGHVFIPHLTDTSWGGKSRTPLFSIRTTRRLDESMIDPLDDEKRLLYVAMTRAKEGLYVSHARMNTDGREMLPSRLLEGIDTNLITIVDTTETERAFEPMRTHVGDARFPVLDPGFLRHTLATRGISATALNNYLKSPWNYFFRNVLRIPETQSLTLQFGTVMHSVLEEVTKRHTTQKKLPDDSEIKELLEHSLGRLAVHHAEYARLHERGLAALLTYIPWCSSALPEMTKEEVSIRVSLPTGNPDLPEVTLTGKLDRLDFDADGNLLRIVDYKTGKPKSRGYIEGTTKDSSGDYKRQLVFYALLLSLYDDPRYRSREGVLSFVEADDKGRIHEEAYTITDEEVALLKADIIRVALEIAHGAFFDAPCAATESDYCDLVALLRRV